ncbi:NADPH-dependent aldehyde reductase [Meredithblackwellia eburnea MCA 4105]
MVQQIKLNSGFTIPNLGFGTWQAPPGEVKQAVEAALKAGYRHLDLAKIYQNQEEVKGGIAASGVPRAEIFITSKLWNSSHRPDLVEPALDDTLKELGLDYLDLYLIHWPIAFDPRPATHTTDLFPKDSKGAVHLDLETTLIDTYKAMIKLLDTGKVKSIGVSNFSIEAIDALVAATGHVPAAHQVERHPLLAQEDLIKHHKEKNIHLTAYSPLGNNNVGKKKLFEYPEVIAIADKLKVTPAQALIAWGLEGGHSVIPKSVTPARIASNFVEIDLPKEDFDEISKLGAGAKRWRFNIPYNYEPSWDIEIFGEDSEKGATNHVNIGK